MTSKGFKIKFSIYRQQSISNCQDIIESDYLPFFHLVCFKRHSCTIAFNKSLFCIVRVDKKYLMNNQMCFSIINKLKKKATSQGHILYRQLSFCFDVMKMNSRHLIPHLNSYSSFLLVKKFRVFFNYFFNCCLFGHVVQTLCLSKEFKK